MREARVIGAGLSGLATAWCLSEAGFGVTVTDRADRAGGLIGSRHTPHGLIEQGANAFVWTESVARWFERLELTPMFAGKRSRRRYIFRDGRPRRWPLGPLETASAVGRLGVAWATGRRWPRPNDTVADYIGRLAGRPATDWLVDPLLRGIYAGPADRLSATVVWKARRRGPRRLAAPRAGMGEFIDRLHEALVARGVAFRWNEAVDDVDLAIPTAICTNAPSAARLVARSAPELSMALMSVSMAPIVSATAFFTPRREDVEGFGVLFPRQTGVRALGVLMNASIFENRSTMRSETWIFGSDSAAALNTDEAVRSAIMRDRGVLSGSDQTPTALYVTRGAPALPIYDEAILEVQRQLGTLPGTIALVGNYLGRIGVASLLEGAELAALRLRRAKSE